MTNNENENEDKSYTIFPSTTYKKELKKYKKNPERIKAILEIVCILSEKGSEGIPPQKRPHPLTGNYKGSLECHIEPDLLLIWTQDDQNREIVLQRIGNHSDLFN